MKFKLQDLVAGSLIACITLTACSTEPNNNMPANKSSQDLEKRVGDLEKEATAGSAIDQEQEQGARLTQQSVSATNEYLAKLYKNINDTRPQDLPEWQDMYMAMTDKNAMEDPDYGLGPRKEMTNFNRLQTKTDSTNGAVSVINATLLEHAATDIGHTKSLEVVLERLATIDRNIKDLNTAVTEKFKSVDKLLAEYDGRITGVENRMKTVEVDLDSFRTEFVGYRQRVTNIETLLRRYDLAVMYNDINILRDITTNHEERILDLTGKVQINTSEITNTKASLVETDRELGKVASVVGGLKAVTTDHEERILDLTGKVQINTNEIAITKANLVETDQELSKVAAEVGGLKVGVAEIFTRLDNCNCR